MMATKSPMQSENAAWGFETGEGTLENSGGALWQEAPSMELS